MPGPVPIIAFEGVSKVFGRTPAVDGVSLTIEEGEFFALLGPSGCGKTTLLRMLAGFETPSAGKILIDGEDMGRTPPNRRPVNMVFQSYAVFPHMSVLDNVAYGLRVERTPASERLRRAEEALALVRLEGQGARRPSELSGGQRQRVALARALVKRPRALLLDEPLSALDAKLRAQMRAELIQLQRTTGVTFLMVTHDQDEALAMASRCAVMDGGRLQQVAAPGALYERPQNRFVAGFIGEVNLFDGVVAALEEGGAVVRTSDLSAPLLIARGGPLAPGDRVGVALRPERIEVLDPTVGGAGAVGDVTEPGRNRARGVIRQITFLGPQSLLEVETEGGRRLRVAWSNVASAHAGAPPVGGEVWLSWPPSAPWLLPP